MSEGGTNIAGWGEFQSALQNSIAASQRAMSESGGGGGMTMAEDGSMVPNSFYDQGGSPPDPGYDHVVGLDAGGGLVDIVDEHDRVADIVPVSEGALDVAEGVYGDDMVAVNASDIARGGGAYDDGDEGELLTDAGFELVDGAYVGTEDQFNSIEDSGRQAIVENEGVWVSDGDMAEDYSFVGDDFYS